MSRLSLFVLRWCFGTLAALAAGWVAAQGSAAVVDLPTRPGVTQRLLVITPPEPQAAVILLAGGHGGLQIDEAGGFGWGQGNFLIRSRQHFADAGLLTVIVDAPSDRQRPPFLAGYRQGAEHAEDLAAVIAWLRRQTPRPVWLVGTSRGTQSAAAVATRLPAAAGPDGLVLTASILNDPKSTPVPALPLDRLQIPVLVVHHENDACRYCAYGDLPMLMDKLTALPRHALLSFQGGNNQGDPCEAWSHHGFNGIEQEVVRQIAGWILER